MRYLAASGRVTYPCDLGRDRSQVFACVARVSRPGHAVSSDQCFRSITVLLSVSYQLSDNTRDTDGMALRTACVEMYRPECYAMSIEVLRGVGLRR